MLPPNFERPAPAGLSVYRRTQMTYINEDTTVFTNHNVYILGAGFSADAGIPLLNNFLYEMRLSMSLLREMGRERERAAIEEVLTFRKRAASAALRVNLDVE